MLIASFNSISFDVNYMVFMLNLTGNKNIKVFKHINGSLSECNDFSQREREREREREIEILWS
jgi:hypothetical protein